VNNIGPACLARGSFLFLRTIVRALACSAISSTAPLAAMLPRLAAAAACRPRAPRAPSRALAANANKATFEVLGGYKLHRVTAKEGPETTVTATKASCARRGGGARFVAAPCWRVGARWR
jgi:hypothetical protein